MAETTTVSAAPQLEQRSGEERQTAGLASHIADEDLNEGSVDLEVGTVCRELDRADEFARLHRPDQHMVGAEQLTEARILAAAAVEVGTQRDDDNRAAVGIERRLDKRFEEHCSLLAVLAGGEDLLELVDDERDSLSRLEARDGLAESRRAEQACQLRTRVLARPHEQP